MEGASKIVLGDQGLTLQIRQCKHLPERQMKALCSRVRDIMVEESNVHAVSSPVTVCGDIHGQFWDVLEIFRQGGEAPENSYIFMVSVIPPCWSGLCQRRFTVQRLTG